jgi:hypothetical protein
MRKFFWIAFCILPLFLCFSEALAEVWAPYKAKSKMFVTRFPSEPEIIHRSMRVSPKLVLHYDEMRLSEDIPGTPYKRHYIIRLDQTFGRRVSIARVDDVLGHTVRRYKEYYESIGASVKSITPSTLQDLDGMEARISLPKKGESNTAIRARIFIDEKTRIQQFVIAPEEYIAKYNTTQFLLELRPNLFLDDTPGTLVEDWKEYPVDDNGYFKFLLPEITPPYLKGPLDVKKKGVRRSLHADFHDPIYNTHILFNAYVYNFGDQWIRENGFMDFILSNHIDNGDYDQRKIAAGDFQGMRFWFDIPPPEDKPDVNFKYVKAYYVNNYFDNSYIIVVETMADRRTVIRGSLEKLISENAFNIEREARANGTIVGGYREFD